MTPSTIELKQRIRKLTDQRAESADESFEEGDVTSSPESKIVVNERKEKQVPTREVPESKKCCGQVF